MKKFFIGLVAVLGMALAMTSCKPEESKVRIMYQLEVDGYVFDSVSNTTSNFNADVTNADLTYLAYQNAELTLVSDSVEATKETSVVSDWVNAEVERSIKAQFGENAKPNYRVHVKGYVKEPDITGAEFRIDKTFTNM